MELYEIKKSKFYSLIFDINSKEEVEQIINNLWKEHKKARHICYAFVYKDSQNIEHYGLSDDGEPKGTAGKPLFNLLIQNQQKNKLIVVIRYFGGIKLGAGLLLRSYVNSGKKVFLQK